MNPQAAWRCELARRAARTYPANEQLAVFTIAGSAGAGVADHYSDLELDCYWLESPSDEQRRRPVAELGGVLDTLWSYDERDQEWSEDYRVDGLDVCVSNFLVSTVDAFLDDVVGRADTHPVKHMRLAAIQRCTPLSGTRTIERWRARAACYPDELMTRMVRQALAPEVLDGWSARDAFLARGDLIAIYELLTRIERATLAALLAVNRQFQAHRLLKWQRLTVGGLIFAPANLSVRLDDMWDVKRHRSFDGAEELLVETADLAQQQVQVDLDEFRAVLAARRRTVVPSPPPR